MCYQNYEATAETIFVAVKAIEVARWLQGRRHSEIFMYITRHLSYVSPSGHVQQAGIPLSTKTRNECLVIERESKHNITNLLPE